MNGRINLYMMRSIIANPNNEKFYSRYKIEKKKKTFKPFSIFRDAYFRRQQQDQSSNELFIIKVWFLHNI